MIWMRVFALEIQDSLKERHPLDPDEIKNKGYWIHYIKLGFPMSTSPEITLNLSHPFAFGSYIGNKAKDLCLLVLSDPTNK